jgi:YD repeat-containing protein
VKTGETASDPAAKTTGYTYDNRGLRATETKGNQNKVTFSWFDNGLMGSSREVKPDGTSLVAEHLMGYDADGNQITDAAKVLNSDTKALDSSTATYGYEPRGRVTAVTRTGAGAANETYEYTATSNISTQTVGGVSTSFVYDRNRLQKATSGTSSSYYNHDPFGRLDTITSGGAVVGRYVYDGFDRVVEQRTVTGGGTKTTKSSYDAWDRVATKTDAAGKTTALSYLGLSSQVLAELDKASNKPTEAYTFDAYGQRLTQTSTKTDGHVGRRLVRIQPELGCRDVDRVDGRHEGNLWLHRVR